mmetsp:Transcript_23586/g.29431  ORF Transcript_23586/g.29431 Transcript_23586/m.29431 type:complete len:357 (-) Transcript_23586:5-1075(-)
MPPKLQRHHRASSSLKQQNKKHKSLSGKKLAGRVAVKKGHSSRAAGSLSKAARVNRAKQLQRQARDALIKKRRELPSEVPHIICVVPLSERIHTRAFVRRIINEEEQMEEDMINSMILGRCENCIYLGADHGDVRGTLECAASADAILVVMASPMLDDTSTTHDDADMESCFSFVSSSGKGQTLLDARSIEAGRVLDALKSQGCPACVMGSIWTDPEALMTEMTEKQCRKLEAASDSLARRFFGSEFGEKLPWKRLDASKKSAQDVSRLVQTQLTKMAGREPAWRHRSVLLAESCFRQHNYLNISGWIRHASMSTTNLLHVPGAGATRIIQAQGIQISSLENEESLYMAAEPDTCW